eukprot:CFRG4053T1
MATYKLSNQQKEKKKMYMCGNTISSDEELNNISQEIVKISPIEKFYTLYNDEVLGTGRFAKVIKCSNNSTGETFACKVINTTLIPKQYDPLQEVEVHLICSQHVSVVTVVDVFLNDDAIYIVMEYLAGGELYHAIIQQVYYPEEVCCDIVRTLLSILLFMHKNNIVHRDLKPENILISGTSSKPKVKLADFGTASIMKHDQDHYSSLWGFTLGYAAPELLGQGHVYGKGVDIWAVGVICYVLLCGYSPFNGADVTDLVEAIQNGEFDFDDEYFGDVSDSAKDFIRCCLESNVADRMTVEELLVHEWLLGADKKGDNITTESASSNMVSNDNFGCEVLPDADTKAKLAKNLFDLYRQAKSVRDELDVPILDVQSFRRTFRQSIEQKKSVEQAL